MPNLHKNELNTTFFLFDELLKGSKSLKIFKITLTYFEDKFKWTPDISNGCCCFKFGVEVGVEESIVNAPPDYNSDHLYMPRNF
jgi:hypothetical protein